MNVKRGLLCLAACAQLCGTVQARSLDDIKAAGKLVIATEGAYAPFNYFQGPRLTGFEVDVGDALAKRLGVAVEWKALSFDALLAGLRQDRWDLVMSGFGITEDRAKAVSFTNPYYCSGGVIVTRDGMVRTPIQLVGKTIAVQTGSTYMDNVQKLPGVKEVKNFPQDTDARSAMVNGRADVWISDRFVAQAAAEKNPQLGLKLGGYLFVERVGGAVKKGNDGLRAALDRALADMMEDGTYKAISDKYFKDDIRCK